MTKLERIIITWRPVDFIIARSKQLILPGFQGLPRPGMATCAGIKAMGRWYHDALGMPQQSCTLQGGR